MLNYKLIYQFQKVCCQCIDDILELMNILSTSDNSKASTFQLFVCLYFTKQVFTNLPSLKQREQKLQCLQRKDKVRTPVFKVNQQVYPLTFIFYWVKIFAKVSLFFFAKIQGDILLGNMLRDYFDERCLNSLCNCEKTNSNEVIQGFADTNTVI